MPRAPPPPLTPPRMETVEAAWLKVAGGADSVTTTALKAAYDARRHPRVLDGNMSIIQAEEALLRQFEGAEDGIITWKEFLQYHIKVSNEVDRSRSLDRETTFLNIVAMAWRLDKDPNAALSPTGIIPLTLECPTGLAATKNLDLVWPSSEPGVLFGFKGVVKCRFGRSSLPEDIRGCFAFQDELVNFTVKYPVSRSVLIAPVSIVWTDESTGQIVGLRDVVTPNADLNQVPDFLRSRMMQADEAIRLYGSAINWLPLAQAYNPTYKKSSESVGVAVDDHARDVLDLKKRVFEGTNCGVAWHGHTGKFTDSFNGGPYKNSSLNTATRKPTL
jgi:hypothetical protein